MLAAVGTGDSHPLPIDDRTSLDPPASERLRTAVSPACASMACPTATGAASRRERRSTWPQRSAAAGRWPIPTSISDAWATCSTPDVPSTWATAGNRPPPHGHDWVIVALGHPGSIEAAVVDTLTSRATIRKAAASRPPSWKAETNGSRRRPLLARAAASAEAGNAPGTPVRAAPQRPRPDHPCTPEHLSRRRRQPPIRRSHNYRETRAPRASGIQQTESTGSYAHSRSSR